MAEKYSFTTAVVCHVLAGMMEEVANTLLDGYNVEVEGIGHFTLSAKAKSEDSPEKVSEKNISELSLHFRPSTLLKKRLKWAEFSQRK